MPCSRLFVVRSVSVRWILVNLFCNDFVDMNNEQVEQRFEIKQFSEITMEHTRSLTGCVLDRDVQ